MISTKLRHQINQADLLVSQGKMGTETWVLFLKNLTSIAHEIEAFEDHAILPAPPPCSQPGAVSKPQIPCNIMAIAQKLHARGVRLGAPRQASADNAKIRVTK